MRAVKHQQIAGVAADAPGVLAVSWAGGRVDHIDLAPILAGTPFAHIAALADAPEAGDWGWDLRWPDGTEFSAAQLWRWAGEQQGDCLPVATERR